MKRFRARSGPFQEQLHFSSQEIDSMCSEALEKAGLLPTVPEPIRIDWFIEKYFGCPVSYDDCLDDGVLGCTAFRTDGSVAAVVVSKHLEDGTKVGERRVRTTLAHEGGHCLMHSSLFMNELQHRYLGIQNDHYENLDFKKRRILCRSEDIGLSKQHPAYKGRWWEWQANRAIGAFLLPTRIIRQAAAPFVELSEVTKSGSLSPTKRLIAERELAEVFDVNPIVVRIRLSELFPDAGGQIEF